MGNSIHFISLTFPIVMFSSLLYRAMEIMLERNEKPWVVNDQKDDGYTALHLAALNNHTEVVELLVKVGLANKDQQNINLQTSLHLAIQKQHISVINVS